MNGIEAVREWIVAHPAAMIGAASAVAYLLRRRRTLAAAIRFVERRAIEESRNEPRADLDRDPRIDLLQPILSGDPDLEAALRDNVLGTSSAARFLWLVDRDDTVGLDITRRLASEFGERVRLIETEPYDGRGNPKIAKLIVGAEAVEAPIVAVLDDDTRIGERELDEAREALGRGVDLHTGLPTYVPADTFWSRRLAEFVNNASIDTYLTPLAWSEPITLNGMFWAMRTERLRVLNPLVEIRGELCDDYALASFLRRRGGTIRQGSGSQRIRTTVATASGYLRLMHRWLLFASILLRDQPPARRARLLGHLGLPALLIWGTLVALLEPLYGVPLVGLVGLGRRHLLRRARRRLGLVPVPFGLLLPTAVEALVPLQSLHAELFRTIRWRTRSIRVERNGRFRVLER